MFCIPVSTVTHPVGYITALTVLCLFTSLRMMSALDVGKRVLNVGTTWVNLRCVTITWRNVNKFLDGHSATRKVRRKSEGPQLERGTATQMDDG